MPSLPVSSPDVLPSPGQAVLIRFDGTDTVVWWGKGEGDREVLAAHDGQLITWPSVEDAVRFADEHGWEIDWDAGITSDQTTLMDFSGAQRRLASERAPVAPHSAVDLWGFATDAAHTLGLTFNDGGRLADECFDKLARAVAPSAFGLDEYRLQWTPTEFKVVRRIITDAVHVVRMALGHANGKHD